MSKWLDNAVFYEIYPQSFNDTNADGIGDFQGIIEKLDYIKELGCNAIWINPCFLSPFGDAGYDVADYCRVAPRYGTNEDLKRVFEEAHKRDMHVLLDLVPGHTSVEHPWFKESMKADRNEFTDRYVWTNNVWEAPEGMGSLRGISERDGACAINFFSNQPALNYGFYQPDPEKPWQQSFDNEGPQATLAAMEDVMRFWLNMGCDGFRVDMAGSLVKNDLEGKGTIRLWQQVRKFLDAEFPDAAMVSEWGEPDKSLMGGFHMDFLLHFGPSHYNDLFRCDEPFFSKRGKGDISEFVETYKTNYNKTAQKGLICIPSGNHDMDRLARRLQGDELKIAFAFLLSMPGAPFIYYGDEIGLNGDNDPDCRRCMEWNPAKQNADVLSFYKKIIRIRKKNPCLRTGNIVPLVCEKMTYGYLCQSANQQIYVLINVAEEATEVRLPVLKIAEYKDLLTGKSYQAEKLVNAGYFNEDMISCQGALKLSLRAFEGIILKTGGMKNEEKQ